MDEDEFEEMSEDDSEDEDLEAFDTAEEVDDDNHDMETMANEVANAGKASIILKTKIFLRIRDQGLLWLKQVVLSTDKIRSWWFPLFCPLFGKRILLSIQLMAKVMRKLVRSCGDVLRTDVNVLCA
jgi:hypothetical protein